MESAHILEHRCDGVQNGRAVLLANPFARSVQPAAIAHAARLLRLDGRAVCEIGRDGTARSLAEQAVRNRVSRLIVAGGDGTIHQVVQVLSDTDVALGIVPLGTSNDLAGRIGIPRGIDGLRVLLHQPRTAALDLMALGGVRIATVGGLGLPAYVADRCNDLRARPVVGPAVTTLGGGIYSLVAAARILRRGPDTRRYVVRLNNGPAITMRAAAALVGLVERFGGGLRLAPNGGPSPGTFSALFVSAATRGDLLRTLVRIRLGRSVGPLATLFSGLTRLSIRTRGLVGTFGDGEWLGLRHRAVMELQPRALRVLVPPSYGAVAGASRALRVAV
jgi:diacylglycerol kinase (ATP)